MKFFDALKLAIQNLWRTKFRTFLTVLGVVIGISAIVLLVSLGIGLQRITAREVAGMNALTTITVTQTPETAAMEAGKALTDESVASIKAIEGVEKISPSVSIPGNVSSGNTSTGAIITGIDLLNLDLESTNLAVGKLAKDENEVIISSILADSFASNKEELIGKEIVISVISDIDGMDYKSKDLSLKIAGIDDNNATNAIYVSMEKINSIRKSDKYSSIKVKVKTQKDVNGIQEQIKKLGYQTTTIKDLIDQIDRIFLLIEIILGIIAGIGLMVSSLGIINTMVISLLERTREIGVMKAIGATNRDIKRLFYFETAFIGLMGGIFGVAVSILVGQTVNYIINALVKESGNRYDLFITPVKFALLMIVFAVLISLFAGIYPAWRAKKLSPMDALRM